MNALFLETKRLLLKFPTPGDLTSLLKLRVTPAVEVGWRLDSQFWGKGYATEGAKAALAFGFNTIGLDEIVSFTVPMNQRSLSVMERIGLQRDSSGDFHHTKLPLDHPFSWHVLYRLKKADYLRFSHE